jgi:hypothetical protein
MRLLLALTLAGIAPATLARAGDSLSVRPDSLPFWTGGVVYHPAMPPPNTWVKQDDVIAWGFFPEMDADRARGWCKFNLASIPDTARISTATLWYCVFFFDTAGTTDIRQLLIDPVPESARSLYEAAGAGPLIGTSDTTRSGWNSIVLDSGGLAAVQQGLAGDWVAMAWDYPGTWHSFIQAHGWQGPDEPFLLLGYELGGVAEATRVAPPNWELSVTPNPTPAEVIVRYTIPAAAGRFRLALYNAAGRRLRSLPSGPGPEPPARQLRLSLKPGTYLLALESAGRPVARKLIVAR